MKNLKEVGKKLNFRVILHILFIIIVIYVVTSLFRISYESTEADKLRLQQIERKQTELLNKIDSINTINMELLILQKNNSLKLDSIQVIKHNITKEYDEEVNNINNSTPNDDAEWIVTKISSTRIQDK